MNRHTQKAVFVALLISLSVSPDWGQQAATTRQCSIKTIIGTAKVRRGNDATWKEARIRMPLKEGDAVRTFVESEVELETSEGTIMKVGENSTVEVPVFSAQAAGATSTKIKILAGSVLSDVKKLTSTSSKFEFETPTAVASIRGTRLGIDVTGDRTNVSVYEGRVFVMPKDAKEGAEVGANQTTTIIKGQRTIKVQNMGQSGGKDTTGAKGAAKDTSARHDTTSSVAPKDTSAATSGRDSTQGARGMVLAVMSPPEGAAFKPGATVSIAGTVSPGATVTVNGVAARVTSSGQFSASYTASGQLGEYDLSIEASLGGKTKSMTRSIAVALASSGQCVLTVTSPADGMKLNRPVVPVSGMVTPGAEVMVSGMKASVLATGAFSLELPIADEENEMSVEIEATCSGQTKTVTRTVSYVPGLVISVSSPSPQQVVGSTHVPVSGMVTPSKATVTCQGITLSKTTNGSFSGVVTIPDEEGSADLEFEAVFGDQSKAFTQTVVYKPVDHIAPTILGSLPQFSKVNRLTFTVNDQTPGDEVTFYHSVDGSADYETDRPGAQFHLDLEEGFHDYVVYAKDSHGNMSSQLSRRGVCYMSSNAWNIRMRKPLGPSDAVFLPPAGPRDDNFQPKYTVQLSVVNLVNDDPKLLKEVSVTNGATGEVQGEHIILDVDFEFDLTLKRGVPNVFTVRVKDVNDVEKVNSFVVTVR